MIVTLRTERIRTIEQVGAFVAANEPVQLQPLDRDGAYAFVARTLTRLGSRAPGRPSKALVKRFLAETTGYSRAQLTRLTPQHRETARGGATVATATRAGPSRASTHRPMCACWPGWTRDLGQMSGLATRGVLHREYHVFGLTAEATSRLDTLNRTLWAWVEGESHHSPHRGLDGRTPLDQWAFAGHGVRFPDPPPRPRRPLPARGQTPRHERPHRPPPRSALRGRRRARRPIRPLALRPRRTACAPHRGRPRRQWCREDHPSRRQGARTVTAEHIEHAIAEWRR